MTKFSKKLVPVCASPDGNNGTSGHAQYKYDFVLNNFTNDELSSLCQTLPTISKKAIVAEEVGEQGTPHLQCYISLKVKKRITELQSQHPCFKRCSFRKCRNEEALEEYVQKDGKIHLKWGYPTPITIIQDLYPWQKEIEKLCMDKPDARKINWYWEQTGNIGKSAFVKYMVVKHKALFCDGGKKADIINLVFNNDMDTCKIVIWDIPRANLGSISYTSLEAIKNGLVCNTKYETGVKAFNPPHIIVFANSPPETPEKLSTDRWNIVNLNC